MRPAVSAGLSRRTLLAGVLAGAVTPVVGCTPSPRPAPSPTPPPLPPADVSSLVADRPFFVAHRGGGGHWPEMTAYAYAQAAQLPGLRALEVSVCRTADGVLVCSHDPTTTRTTGAAYTIAEQRWADLAGLRVSAHATTDPTQPAQPLSRFDEVAATYLDRFVLFVEAKVGAAIAPLMQLLAESGQPQRVVWKAPVNSRHFTAAKDLGFSTWGYVLEEPAHLDHLQRFAGAPEIDLLGAPRSAGDGVITAVNRAAQDHGKVTISWTIRSREDERRVTGLGCRGLMTSHPRAVVRPVR